MLLLAAGQTVGAASSPLVAGAVFPVLATLPITGAACHAPVGGTAAEKRLDRTRVWLVAHNRLMTSVVCTLLGAVLLAEGSRHCSDRLCTAGSPFAGEGPPVFSA